MKKNNTTAHNNLKNEILVAISSKYYPHCFACGRSVGTFIPYHGKIPVKIGIAGEPDIYALIHGISFFIEVKTGTGRLRDDQKRFRDMIISAGGIHIEARELDTVMQEISQHIALAHQ